MNDPQDPDMKADWNARARENARFYIASHEAEGEDAFVQSGERDVGHFFDGLRQLLHGDQVVLDIGCGLGRMDQFVAPHVGFLHGLDVSGEMVRGATERLAGLGISNVKFHEGDGWTLGPIGDASIGLVFSHIVFQHMPRHVVESYLPEVRRVLQANGDFVFQMPEAVPGAPADPPDLDTFEMRFWTEEDLRTRLEALGFEWLECRRFPVESPKLNFNQLRIHCRLTS